MAARRGDVVEDVDAVADVPGEPDDRDSLPDLVASENEEDDARSAHSVHVIQLHDSSLPLAQFKAMMKVGYKSVYVLYLAFARRGFPPNVAQDVGLFLFHFTCTEEVLVKYCRLSEQQANARVATLLGVVEDVDAVEDDASSEHSSMPDVVHSDDEEYSEMSSEDGLHIVSKTPWLGADGRWAL